MDDMISRLSEILDNPEQTEKIKKIAASMMGPSEEQKNSPEANAVQVYEKDPQELQDPAGPQPTSRSYDKLFTTMNCSKNVTLLNAIRPYMRNSRAEKIGSAIKAMEMIELLSKLK